VRLDHLALGCRPAKPQQLVDFGFLSTPNTTTRNARCARSALLCSSAPTMLNEANSVRHQQVEHAGPVHQRAAQRKSKSALYIFFRGRFGGSERCWIGESNLTATKARQV